MCGEESLSLLRFIMRKNEKRDMSRKIKVTVEFEGDEEDGLELIEILRRINDKLKSNYDKEENEDDT